MSNETRLDVETLAAEIRGALDEAHDRVAKLSAERDAIRTELKQIRVDIQRLERLRKAVTPRDQNGDHE